MLKITAAICASVLWSAFTIAQPMYWEIQKGYAIQFSGSRVSGEFMQLSGSIDFDPDNLEASKFDVAIAVKSINTGKSMMNKHAIGEDWFDAERYPQIRFVSSEFSKAADHFSVKGKLTMHGITQEISIPFTFSNHTFTGKFAIKRGDYKVGGTSGISGWVAPTLEIEVSVPVKPKE